ncbi:MAG: metal ABC transporter ATP-binding protein [Candidatus Uhrbacteria bacterium]|nr:metal ABC transporter ATP-binding protein [Candidatus Uhrbacteria bacterium]
MHAHKDRADLHSALTVQHLCVSFDNNEVLKDVSFTLSEGTIAAVIGPNGSGKTTLISTILGLVKPEKGEIKILGRHLHEVRHLIGYVPQRFHFDKYFPITVREYLDLARHKNHAKSRIEEKIREVGLDLSILTAKLGTLSGGQLQRVLIAQAILNNPSILILDEPATGIDIVGEAAFVNILKHLNEEHNTTILLVSHDVTMVMKFVDEVICVNKKLLCAGPPRTALTPRKLEDLYGGESHLYEHSH